MKSNVDLTTNRDFRKERSFNLSSLLGKKVRKYPWVLLTEYTGQDHVELILLGSKKDRQSKMSYYNRENSCERCGYDFSKKEWEGSYGLCNSCNIVMGLEIKYEIELVLGKYYRMK